MTPRPRNFRRFLLSQILLAALAFAAFSAPRFASADDVAKVPIHKIGPTQEEVGQAAVDSMKKFWLGKKPADMATRDWLLGHIKQKFGDKQFEGIRDPNGVVRILDGHHRARMLSDFAKEYGVRYVLKVKIVKDYTGWTMRDYSHDLVNSLNKGQFSARTRRLHPAKQGQESHLARVRRLPKTVAACKDSPLRSAVGTALFKAGIDSDMFADYIEFKLGDRLYRAKGVKTQQTFLAQINTGGSKGEHKVVHELQRELFSPTTLAYLAKNVRPGFEADAQQLLRSFKRTKTYRNARRRALRRVHR